MRYLKIGLALLAILVVGLFFPAGGGMPVIGSSENETASMIISLPDMNGEEGQVWQSDGQGGAQWATIVTGNGTVGEATWGSILGTLSNQLDLQGALDSKETPSGAQSKVNAHDNAYNHDDIALNTTNRHTHSNKSVLDATQESFTTALKSSYSWLVSNITSVWKASVDNFIGSKGQASGIAPLDANSKVPTINLGGAGADGTKFLRGDQTWAVPSSGGGSVNYKAGTVTTSGSGVATVTFNTAMPSTNYAISLTPIGGADTIIAMYDNKSINGFGVSTQDDSGKTESNVAVDWVVIEYNNP